jgi:GWxTD domain-containing protein
MMRFLVFIACLPLVSKGQSVFSINTSSSYDPQNEITFVLKPVKQADSMVVFFELKALQISYAAKDYSINWEKRDYYSQKNGETLSPQIKELTAAVGRKGKLKFAHPEKPWILLAKIKNTSTGTDFAYYTLMDPKYPVNGFLENNEQVVFNSFVPANQQYTFNGSGNNKPLHVYYYSQDFPAGSPPFAEKSSKVDRFMFADSTFTISPGTSHMIRKEGLYLVQEDSNSTDGFAFRGVNETYPKFTRLDDLTGPLIFIATKEEHDELLAANNEKAKFDKVILDITKDKDRARNFIRSYFRRVELANQYFTSYKEGWKTDRGMIYMIFGLPNEVSHNENNEIWFYKNSQTRFTFIKTGSVYDPDYYVLLRDKRFMEIWYSTIDLWRKSRF